ncbi:MAG: galactokinase [Spirochaetaceae bacterium]|jgi:galactokinase|nr:galactokinase [Spirochaetaceae bacterium]
MQDIGTIHRAEYELSGNSEQVVIAEAPGRLHYLGEHGEIGAGLYLSSAINRSVQVAVSSRKDNSFRFFAADLSERKRTTLINLKYKREDRWANYIKLAIHIFAEAGFSVKGLNFTISGNIPQQAGLASSTAIEAAAAVALRRFFKASVTDRGLIQKLIRAETEFLGREGVNPVDYLIAFNAKKDHFLVIDEKTGRVAKFKSPYGRYKMLLLDSRVPRMGVEEELKQRREDARQGLEILTRKRQGESFRDYVPSDLLESMGDLREEIRRRSLHIVEENQRIREAVEALQTADIAELSKAIFHSHESLRDLFEVSCPEIDWLVKRAQEIEGVAASRMTGSGFGGCTYTILKESALEQYRKRLEDYERIFGFHPLVYDFKPASGARLIVKR